MIQTSEKQETSQSPAPHATGSGSSSGESSDPATCSTSAGVVEANTTSNDAQYPPDVKVGFDELCPVCGDKVSGYHYGLLTCESCKGFFKRTVQNKKVYSCVDNRSCHIDKSQRKRCPFCRFQKCLSVGMKLEAVRSDRMRGGRNKFGPMYKRDRALKQQAARQASAMFTQCQMHLANGNMPSTAEAAELKPDPSLLTSSIPSSLSSSPGRGGPPSPLSYPPTAGSPGGPGVPVRPPTTSTSPVPRGGGGGGGGHSYYGGGQGASDPYLLSPGYPSVMGLRMSYQGHAPHMVAPPSMPQLLADLKHNLSEDLEVKQKLLTFIQSEFGQASASQPGEMLHLVCKLVDQLLFLMVEWARNCIFFKEMKVEDQMKLLQNCWSEILILDLVHRHVHQSWGSEIILSNGQKISLDLLDDFGLSDIKGRMLELMKKVKDLHIDAHEYLCLKFLILLNPDVTGLENKQHVEQSQERVNAALLEYCLNFYPDMKDKFGQVLLRLPEIRVISIRSEEFLYCKHLNGEIPDQTLLMEMLHSKKK